MKNNKKPIIAITMGDPCGIGPEIISKSLNELIHEYNFQPLILGNLEALEFAQNIIKTHLKYLKIDSISRLKNINDEVIPVMDNSNLDFRQISPGKIYKEAGSASIEWIHHSGELAMEKSIQAIVSSPINKEACRLTGNKLIGHMELFQNQTKSKKVSTMLMTPGLRVVHLTTHKSLIEACKLVTFKNVYTSNLSSGQITGIPDRKISADTCKAYNVTTLTNNGTIFKHIYPYYDDSNTQIATKIRTVQNKGFLSEGNMSGAVLFGRNKFSAKGKYITITEGELDAMAAYQMFGSKWPCVSVKSSSSALTDCKKSFDYLNSFENII